MTKTNKIHVVLYGVLTVIAAVLLVVCCKLSANNKKITTALHNSYDRAFFELSDYVSDIDILLTKAQLASTPAQLASISNEIFMQSAEAKSCFGQLPSHDINLEKTAKFLSQVGDYTYVLSQNMINGQKISKEEYENLSSLNEYAAELSKSLGNIEEKIYNGEISFGMASADDIQMRAFAAEDIFADLEKVEKSFEGYPSLIYDGPFSEHIENAESVMLKSADEISKEDAKERAKNFTGIDGLEFDCEMTNTAIDCYMFGYDDGNVQTSIGITKKGGYVLYFLKNRSVDKMNLDSSTATDYAKKYLLSHGFNNMQESYFEITDNIATINFAYAQNGIKMYSDLVKVRVALDDGEVIGIECKGYLMNHKDRGELREKLTEDEARNMISTNLAINSVSLAVIPKDSLNEILCYEFHGTYKDKNFIIYINAENGREERILLLIESESGILTI